MLTKKWGAVKNQNWFGCVAKWKHSLRYSRENSLTCCRVLQSTIIIIMLAEVCAHNNPLLFLFHGTNLNIFLFNTTLDIKPNNNTCLKTHLRFYVVLTQPPSLPLSYMKKWISFSTFILFCIRNWSPLTSSHWRPYKHAISFGTGGSEKTSKRTFRFFVCFSGSLVNTPRVVCHCGAWLVYMQSFLGVHGVMVRWPRTKGTANNEFTLFVDFCLIPLSKTCSFDVPTKNL